MENPNLHTDDPFATLLQEEDIEKLATPEQLRIEIVKFDETNIGMTDGGLILSISVFEKSKFGPTNQYEFMRSDRSRFQTLFGTSTDKQFAAADWGVGDVVTFEWKGYHKLRDGRTVKNLVLKRIGTKKKTLVTAAAPSKGKK